MASLTSQLLVRLIDGVSGPAKAAAGALAGIGNAARGISGVQAKLHAAIERNNTALAAARGRMFDAVAAGYALQRALTAPIKAAVDFETTLEDLGQKAGLSGDNLKVVGKRIREIARATNQGIAGTAKGIDFLVGMGLGGKTDAENVENALGMAPAIGKTATAYRGQFEELAQAAHSVFLNLKTPADQMQRAFDAMGKAGLEGGFELKDMARYFPAITAAAQFAGMKGVPAVADLAAALQIARTGAADAEAAGRNMENFFQKLTLKETIKNFKKFGIDVLKEMKTARTKGISPIEHIMELLKKATKGNEDLISQLFGDKQVLEFVRPMWANMERYKKIRAEALNSVGLTEEMFARRMKTSQAAIDRFNISLENLKINLGTAFLPGLTLLLDKIGPVVDVFARWAEQNPKLAASIVAVTAGLIGFRVAAIGAAFAGRLAWAAILQISLAATVAARGMWMLVASMAGFVVGPIIAAFASLRSAMIGYAAAAAIAGHGGALRIMAASLLGLLNPLALVRAAMVALKFAIFGTGIGAIIAIIAAAGLLIYNNWSGIKEMFAGIWEGLTSALAPVMPAIQPVIDGLSWLYDKFMSITGPIDASKESWRSLGKTIGESLGGAIRSVIELIKSLFGWLAGIPGKIAGMFSAANSAKAGSGAAPTAGSAPAASGALPKRARGGPLDAGQPTLVGEQGPEIITAGRSGYVHPNDSLRGGMGGATFHFGSIVIQGVQDPEAIARRIKDDIAAALRGIQADYGFKFT